MSHIKDLSDMAERWGFAKGLLAAARLAIDAGNPQLAVAIVELGNPAKTVEPPPPAPLILRTGTLLPEGWHSFDGKTVPTFYSFPPFVKIRFLDGTEMNMPDDFDWLNPADPENPVVAYFDEIPF